MDRFKSLIIVLDIMSIEENPIYRVLKVCAEKTRHTRMYPEGVAENLPDMPIDTVTDILKKCDEAGYVSNSTHSVYGQNESGKLSYGITLDGNDLVEEIGKLTKDRKEKHGELMQIGNRLRRLDRLLNFS